MKLARTHPYDFKPTFCLFDSVFVGKNVSCSISRASRIVDARVFAPHAKGRNRSKKQENVKRSTGRHAASARNLSKVFSPEGSSDCSSSLEARSNLKGRVVVFGEFSLFFNTAENQDEMCFGTVTRMVMMASKGGVLVRFPDRDKNTAIYTGDVCTFNFA